ncbi:MAG: hypothetical protein ACRDKH_03725 [Solirubrobacterales bacterium]
MTLHRGLAAALLTTAALAFGGCGDDEDGGGDGSAAGESGGTLFTQTTNGGTLEAAEGGYTLTLSDPSPAVIAFSDRPERVASRETLEDFVGAWEERGFAEVPPNAALVTERGSEQRAIVLELSEPRLSEGRLSYRAKEIEEGGDRLSAVAPEASARPPARFVTAQLFIDDASGQQMYPLPVDITASGNGSVSMSFDSPVTLNVTDDFDFTFQATRTTAGFLGARSVKVGSGQFQVPITAPNAPITGTATVDRGMRATVSVNAGPQQPLKNGRFSLSPNLGG